MTDLAEKLTRRPRPATDRPPRPAGFGDGLRGFERKESRTIRLIKRIGRGRTDGVNPWLPGDPL